MKDFLNPIGYVIIAFAVVLLLIGYLYARNYIKVPPNKVGVFTGRGEPKYVRGGARFKMPIIERYDDMELEPFNVQVQVKDIFAVDGVRVNIDGVGLIKFGSTDEAIKTAVERFLTSDRTELHHQVQEILAGNMRGIVAQMTIENLNKDREGFRARVLAEATADFQKIGMELDVLTIQNISDPNGYLDALGMQRIAEVKRDAAVGQANAERETLIKSAEARQAGQTAVAQSETAIAQANRERDLELANIQADVNAANERAAQAGPLAMAEARRAVVVAEAEAESAGEQAHIAVEQQRAARAEAAQRADVIVPAEAARQAALLRAEGEKGASIAAAQAEAESRRLAGAADAEARRLEAGAVQAELEAQANGDKAKLLAQAEGQAKMAEALGKYTNEAARLQVLPQLIEALPQIMREVAAPMGQIDNIVMIDSGGADGQGGATSRFADMLPMLLAKGLPVLKQFGIDLGTILSPASSQAAEPSPNGEVPASVGSSDS